MSDSATLNDTHTDADFEDSEDIVTVRDVSELLHAEYAIITGGKSNNGCPIITFPDKGNFHQLTDEEYRKLIIYLTSVPSLQDADLGFVLIVDRRTDKWHSVKTVLLKIAGFFPGLIAVVYVLRPGGFLQKAISEVSAKFFRDEFKFKVVICSGASELHTFINKNQLTENLEGCIQYNHKEWIDQRVAVEKFSANTQDISSSLRHFTQNLQETEFPNDVSSCEKLLIAQLEEYKELKEDLFSASKHGELLLECIKNPSESKNTGNVAFDEDICPDKLINITAVERLLVQLEETEKTFDTFWFNHERRLSQCLELRKFENEFRDIQHALEGAINTLSEMIDTGDSVASANKLLNEAQDFHKGFAEELRKGEELHLRGVHVMEKEHFGTELIQPKCVELVRLRETFHNLIGQRLHTLQKSKDLHLTIEKANRWCGRGVDLLASQQIERYQTPEVAEESLKELEEFLSSSSEFNSGTAREMKTIFDDVTSPETKALVHQVLKRLEDVTLMCEKRKCSLKKISSRLPRPVHAVTPEPAVPLPYALTNSPMSSGVPGVQAKISSLPSLQPYNLSSDLKKTPNALIKSSSLTKSDENDSADVRDPEILRAKRGHVLKELLETEQVYVSELCSILKGYKDAMLSPEMQAHIPINLYGKTDILFGNMEEIFRFHNDIFLRDLENCISTPELIGLCFVHRKDTFHHLYSLYCQNKPQSEELRRQVGDNNVFFNDCQKRLGHKLPLGAYLLKPVQRITKYQLLLKDLLKCTDEAKGRSELQEAVETMLDVLKCLNDSMHQVSITGYPGNLSDLGRLLMQGPFCVWNEKKSLRDLRLKPAQRHIFLYDKMLLFTKRAGKDTEKETYHFKNALKMSQIGLTESIKGNKGDNRKFEVWLQGRQEVYTILAQTPEIKDLWVSEIKKVLLDQFEYLKGENIKQYSSRIQKGASINGIIVPPHSPTSLHRSLRQTASWDIAGSSFTSENIKNSNCDYDITKQPNNAMKFTSGSGFTLGNAHGEEEEPSWSSDYSPSDEEAEELETFTEEVESSSSRFVVLADYNAMGSSEVSLRESDSVDLIKVGCAGWWYVKVCGTPYEGWAPAAYLERVIKKGNRSSPSVSSQDSTTEIRPATSRSSVASISNKSEDVNS